MSKLELTINGVVTTVADAPLSRTLLEQLRLLGLVGTKEGCAEGDCGACTVALLDADDGRAHYRAINSCLLPLAAAAGREVVTVEGLGTDAGHPVQQALIAHGGSQCGYCTPGFVMSLFTAYYGGEAGDGPIEGNLCRCTGYLPIRRAAASLGAPAEDDPFAADLERPAPSPAALALDLVGGRFFRPTTLDEALARLAEHPGARALAGGTDLTVEMHKFGREVPVLVSLEAIPELQACDEDEDGWRLGAALPLSVIERRLRGRFPALDTMLSLFAARQVRNRSTLGGNLGTASPIGDLAPVLLALDAELELAGPGGRRRLALADFFLGYRRTALAPGELIVAARLPGRPPAGSVRRLSRAYKVGKRGSDDISIVAAAFTLDLDGAERVVRARLAYGGVAPIPARAAEVERWLRGRPWGATTVREAAERLRATFSPIDDHRGSGAYRRRLVGNLFEKFAAETTAEEVPA